MPVCFLAVAVALMALAPALLGQTAGPSATTELEALRREFLTPPDDSRIMMRWWWFGPTIADDEIAGNCA